MSTNAVRSALESRLSTWASARTPSLRIAWQNVEFAPAAGETYLRAFILPATTLSQTLDGLHRAYSGVFQVTIITPLHIGSGAALGIAAELDALFPVNQQMTASGVTTQVITPASVGVMIQDESTFEVPVSFRYRADTI